MMKYDIEKIRQVVKNNSCSGLDCRECPVSSYNSPNREPCDDIPDFKKLKLWLQENDKEQITEEQYRNLLYDTACCKDLNVDLSVDYAKEKGYIKQTELEIAKAKYNSETHNDHLNMEVIYKDDADLYVNMLEEKIKELERLKGE